jgi:oxaloacetate decarboxylase alpha subunit
MTAAIVKAVDAGVDNVDTAISSTMTYGLADQSVVAIFQGGERDARLNEELLEGIAALLP